MRHIILIICLLGSLFLAAGCGVQSYFSNDRVAVVPYDPNAMRSIQQGRAYAAEGRYELAKEQYLMALASSNDGSTQAIASHELEAVDRMIHAQR